MLLLGDCNDWLKEINGNSIDLICTDPPYGIEFMGKDWDKALVPTETWKECYRVLKEGKLAFVMCSPRQDVLSRMIINLSDAGFRTNYTSIYWTFASGFPKAANISKLIDKKNGRYFDTSVKDYLNQKRKEKGLSFSDINKYLGDAYTGGGTASSLMGDHDSNSLPTVENYLKLKSLLDLDNRFDDLIEREEAEREILETKSKARSEGANYAMPTMGAKTKYIDINITKAATEEAKKMEGAYVGFQPKPAVEVILVVSKGKTLTWLDDCRIPYQSEDDLNNTNNATSFNDKPIARNNSVSYEYIERENKTIRDFTTNEKGRFPANLLVSDDVLNDGKIYKVGDLDKSATNVQRNCYGVFKSRPRYTKQGDEGSYSRYFSLDAWAKTFPFLIVPKASSGERNKGLDRYLTVKLLSGDMDEIVRCPEGLTAAVQLLRKVTSGLTLNYSIDESGENISAQFPKASFSTILTEIRKIIESKTFNLLTHLLIKDFIPDANLLMANGGNHAVNVESLRKYLLTITNEKTGLAHGVISVANKMLWKIKEKEGLQESSNFHSTVKPLKLMSYLITMGSREGDLVLDPFCGSGTVCIAAHQLHRKWLGIEMNPEYAEIIKKRLADPLAQLKLTAFA